MSDLIKLLRGYRIDARYPEEVMRQAADEIERLRGLLGRCLTDEFGISSKALRQEIEAALAGAAVQPNNGMGSSDSRVPSRGTDPAGSEARNGLDVAGAIPAPCRTNQPDVAPKDQYSHADDASRYFAGMVGAPDPTSGGAGDVR